MQRIVIFTEAGTNPGLGHITRCSALYDAAINLGYRCELVVFSDMNDIEQLAGRESIVVDWKESDFIESYLNKDDFCIIDSYLADYKTYQSITDKSQKCIYIDDTARLDYPIGGIIVNPSLHFDVSRYNGKECYNGMEYVILRKEFLDCQRTGINENVKQILVTMGGSDPRNITPIVLKLLNEHFTDLKVKVIIGKAFNYIDKIEEQVGSNIELIFDADAQTMKKTMMQSDFAISAAGQTIYELLATQTPFIPIQVIDNQSFNVKGLWRYKLVGNVVYCESVNFIEELTCAINSMESYDNRFGLYYKYKDLFDGFGGKRVISKLLKDVVI
jgi:UDP-2,4-diacetamido-2,4,6-trideoxy-beta-L-altropyranose hydrolase